MSEDWVSCTAELGDRSIPTFAVQQVSTELGSFQFSTDALGCCCDYAQAQWSHRLMLKAE